MHTRTAAAVRMGGEQVGFEPVAVQNRGWDAHAHTTHILRGCPTDFYETPQFDLQ